MNPAAQVRAKMQEKWPGATVHSRGKGWLLHQHPSLPRKFALDTQVLAHWHYGGVYDQDHEVDMAWVASGGAWDYEVTKNDFHCYVRDSVPVSYRYVDAATSYEVELTVNAVEWVNDSGQSEVAKTFSQVTPAIDDNRITWNGIATGWDVEVEAQTTRLAKKVTIDSLANLGAPTLSGTVYLSFSMRFQRSSALDIWINGELWDEKQNNPQLTTERVEFRAGSNLIFSFRIPQAISSLLDDDNDLKGGLYLKSAGNNLFAEVRFPWSWLQTAVFPIVIDPTIDPDPAVVGASTDDSKEDAAGNCNPTATTSICDNLDEWEAFRWQGITIPDGATIDNATVDLNTWNVNLDEPNVDIDFEQNNNAAAFGSGNNDISSRTPVSATAIVWNPGDCGCESNTWYGDYVTLPDLKALVQELVDDYSGLSSANIVARFTCRDDTGNYDMGVNHYDNDSGYGAKLHVEYTESGGPTGQPMMLRATTVPHMRRWTPCV